MYQHNGMNNIKFTLLPLHNFYMCNLCSYVLQYIKGDTLNTSVIY